VAAEADGAIDEQPAALGLEVLQDFRRQHGNVTGVAERGRQIPNSDNARASSSVYGSRWSLATNRS